MESGRFLYGSEKKNQGYIIYDSARKITAIFSQCLFAKTNFPLIAVREIKLSLSHRNKAHLHRRRIGWGDKLKNKRKKDQEETEFSRTTTSLSPR
jgi:hypothetical protein